MKNIKYFLPILFLFMALSANAQNDDMKKEGEKVEAKELSDGTLYGADINADSKILTIADIYADTAGFSGKTVVVKGNMSELCRSGGCWTVISDGSMNIRALTLHKFIMPKEMDITGKVAVIEGVFSVKEITEDQAKHFAEEAGTDPNLITGPQKMYRITATGIKILK
ncbi:MAG TPA: DUF4920 domain-containing protein [Ignavibacteria bacterium]|nr:DUF4920 domain-containing protein [Ignavibacteria bacterium]HMQ99094.1 DUF4920 domain-containing protein [Ignavibacteria bacterium]